jgi:hypothetical protein
VAAEPVYKDEQEEGLFVKRGSVNCCLARSWDCISKCSF